FPGMVRFLSRMVPGMKSKAVDGESGSVPIRWLMVGAEGFEPPTLCSQSRCATRLRYAPIFRLYRESLLFPDAGWLYRPANRALTLASPRKKMAPDSA